MTVLPALGLPERQFLELSKFSLFFLFSLSNGPEVLFFVSNYIT